MLEVIAVTLAAVIIPTAPINEISPETYLGYGEQTAYVQQADVRKGTIYIHPTARLLT